MIGYEDLVFGGCAGTLDASAGVRVNPIANRGRFWEVRTLPADAVAWR